MKFKLNEIGDLKNGANFPSGSYGKGIPIVNVKDLFTRRYVDKDNLTELNIGILKNPNDYDVQENDILFSRSSLVRSGAGMCALAHNLPINTIFCGFIIRFRVKRVDIVNPLYVLYLLRTPGYRKLFTDNQQTNITNINQETLGNIEIDLPPLEIQNKVVARLSNIDDKYDVNNSIIAELESMAKTLYDYWFLQFEFPNEEGKPYKSSGGKMVYNEELKREIPEGWILKHAVDIAEIKTGKEDANHSTENGQYPFFTCSNDTLKCDDYKFDSNSILIAGNGDFNVKHYKGKFNAYQRTYVITPFNEKYIGLFELCCKQTIERFKKGSNGSIVKFITLGDIQNIQMLDSGQDDLLKPFNNVLVKIDVIKKENQELASLRDFLLPMLMNGQVKFGEN